MSDRRRPPPAYTAPPDSGIHATSHLYRSISGPTIRPNGTSPQGIIYNPTMLRTGMGCACRPHLPLNDTQGARRMWAARTRQIHASHVSVGDRLWSNLPYLRPLVTITGDSLGGGQLHDTFDFHCHSNLTRSVVPYGLTELDVHDVLNVFQVTGLDEEGKYFTETSPAKPESDLSNWGWDDKEGGMGATCRPLGVEVYQLTDEKVLKGWKAPESPKYRGDARNEHATS
ncbi:hypothetical protein N7523_006519 [Penicillium sp. IBT 18751x]|nr:hypothetical protein N7523_006519 [Penicillium sp. IBT 18751x]